MENHFSKDFSSRIAGASEPVGVEWLKQLPHILENAANQWSIELLPPFQPLSYHYVSPAILPDGEPVVLKVGVPNRQFSAEINALRHFGGHGAVRLIKADATAGLMSLERIVPGVPLQRMQVMISLHLSLPK